MSPSTLAAIELWGSTGTTRSASVQLWALHHWRYFVVLTTLFGSFEAAQAKDVTKFFVFFQAQNSELDAVAEEEVSRAAESAKALAVGGKSVLVGVVGHTSSDGSRGANLLLSRRRAEATCAALVRNGLKAEQIRTTPLGSAAPLKPGEPNSGLNRRAEILVPAASPVGRGAEACTLTPPAPKS